MAGEDMWLETTLQRAGILTNTCSYEYDAGGVRRVCDGTGAHIVTDVFYWKDAAGHVREMRIQAPRCERHAALAALPGSLEAQRRRAACEHLASGSGACCWVAPCR